jgi:hypothetical protein
MTTPHRAINPFALMTDPKSVLDAVERSGRLGQLKRRVCRPLDGPSPIESDDDAEDGGIDVAAGSDGADIAEVNESEIDPVAEGDAGSDDPDRLSAKGR